MNRNEAGRKALWTGLATFLTAVLLIILAANREQANGLATSPIWNAIGWTGLLAALTGILLVIFGAFLKAMAKAGNTSEPEDQPNEPQHGQPSQNR